MSLEKSIQDLTSSVDRLYAMLESRAKRFAIQTENEPTRGDIQVEIPYQTTAEPVAKDEAKKVVTHDDLKSACLLASRADAANKSKAREILASYGASKAADVPADKLLEAIDRIEALI